MELDIGKHCSLKECNMLDYCPFLCQSCSEYYCLNHRMPKQHYCNDNPVTIENTKKKNIKNKSIKVKKTKTTVKCDVCKKKIRNYVVYPFQCTQCGINVCESHRIPEYHNCVWLKKNIIKDSIRDGCMCF